MKVLVENEEDFQLAQERYGKLNSKSNRTAEDTADMVRIGEAILKYEKDRLYESAGRVTGPRTGPDFDMDELKRKDAKEAEAKSDRLKFVDPATGRTVTALNPNESFAKGEDFDVPVISDFVMNRPSAALQRTDSASAGGFLVPEVMWPGMIDMARNRSVCIRAGARSANFEGGSLTIARATGDPTAEWRGEGQSIDPSEATFDLVRIVPKFLGCIVPLTIEMLEDAKNSEQILRSAIAAAMALNLDLYALRGPASGAGPTGLRYANGVNLIDYADLGAITYHYAPISRAVRTILDENFDGDVSQLSWIQCPKLDEAFDTLLDTTLQPLAPSPWARKLKRFSSKQIPDNITTDKTEVYIGPFDQMVFFFRQGLRIELLPSGTVVNSVTSEEHNLTQQWKVVLRASFRVDVCIMRPSWFSIIHNHPTTFE